MFSMSTARATTRSCNANRSFAWAVIMSVRNCLAVRVSLRLRLMRTLSPAFCQLAWHQVGSQFRPRPLDAFHFALANLAGWQNLQGRQRGHFGGYSFG